MHYYREYEHNFRDGNEIERVCFITKQRRVKHLGAVSKTVIFQWSAMRSSTSNVCGMTVSGPGVEETFRHAPGSSGK